MKNSIAVVAALGVVAFFFGQELFPAFGSSPAPASSAGDSTSLINFPAPDFSRLDVRKVAVASQAWAVFDQYREFAKEGDLEGVKSLSHQVSDTCLDPEQREECNALMQSVYLFTENWEQKDFTNIAYDGRQIVMSTDYFQTIEDGSAVKTVIFFTRASTGEPRVLGIKFCFGEEDSTIEKCVDTDPATRDQDDNGWWDDIEERFYDR